MTIDDDLIQALQDDPIAGLLVLTRRVSRELADGEGWSEREYNILIDVNALLRELQDADLLPLPVILAEVSGEIATDCQAINRNLLQITTACELVTTQARHENSRAKFRASLSRTFIYQFSTGDLERVQTLISELREHIAAATNFKEEHRRRLLMRLEKLQAELHKKMSDLDKFWGLVGDAGVVMRKIGEDAKPIVDRIRELTGIVWSTQGRAEELPSGTPLPPMLGSDSPPADDDRTTA